MLENMNANLLLTSFQNQCQIQELFTLRNILQGSLMEELTLNKILLQNSIFQSSSQAPTNTHGSQEGCYGGSSHLANDGNESQMDEDDQKRSSLKLSHNSSLRNDTKNIPKNYGKAILSYIQRSQKARKLATQMGVPLSDLMMQVRRMKKKVNSIEGLKKMWGADNLDHKVKKCIRILSYQFMRKHCLRYIFNSKVRNYGTHIKYRQKLIEGIEDPVAFNHIKDY